MAIKLLIADVDGTMLTRTKALTLHTIRAVDRLRAAGVRFTITSGRPPRGMAALVEPLQLTEPLAAFNGAVYVKPDLTVLSQRTIAPAVAHDTVDYLLRAGLDVWVYQGTDWFVRDLAATRVARESSNVGFEPIVIADLHGVLEAPAKIVGVSMDHALVARCEAELGEQLGERATAARSQPYYLDVTHPEANKGMVVREAARILRIPLSEVATIGDMPNDVPMLEIAGMGIAMANASAEVQRAARHVTLSNDEDGFAHAVDNFVLGDPAVAATELGLPPRARACLFGLDGVLAPTARLHAEAWKRLCDPYLRERASACGEPFVPFDPLHDYASHFEGKTSPQDIRSFTRSRGIELPDHALRALAEHKTEILADLLQHEHLEPYEGSLRYVQAARAAGLRTAVVCSNRHGREAIASAGIADLFDVRLDGGSYLDAAEALGVDAEEAVVFDDELAGVEAGRAGHFGYVVGVDRSGHADDLRGHGADVVVSDLSALLARGD